jgi:hypothetical protein
MNKYGVKISDHARERAYERFKIDASQLKFLANKALDAGIDVFQDETLRDMFLEKSENKNPSGIYLYEGIVYVFIDDILITVYPLSFVSEYQET